MHSSVYDTSTSEADSTDIADELREGPYKPSDIMSPAKMAAEWLVGGGTTVPPVKHTFIHYKFDDNREEVSEDCSSESSQGSTSTCVPHTMSTLSTTETMHSSVYDTSTSEADSTDIADELREGPYKPSDIMSPAKMAAEWLVGGGSTVPPVKHTFIHYKFGDDGEAVSESCSSKSSQGSTLKRSASAPYTSLTHSTTKTMHSSVYDTSTNEADSRTSKEYEAVAVEVARTTQESSASTGASIPSGQFSVGSQLHETGQCTPCRRLNMRLGCLRGKECDFCHFPHPDRKRRARPCKSKRMESKRSAHMALEKTCDQDRDTERTQSHDKADMPGAVSTKLSL